jgi:RNA polymerase sigma-70 factor (ECF subfamily)
LNRLQLPGKGGDTEEQCDGHGGETRDPRRFFQGRNRRLAASNVCVSIPEPTDGDTGLVAASASGDRQAFGRLVERHSRQVYATAYLVTRDRAAADDVTQEVFLRLLTRIGQFRGEARFSSWLHRIAANVASDANRTMRRLDALEGDHASLVSDAPQHASFERRQRTACVHIALRSLTPRLRAPLILRYVRGMSYEEIGQALNIAPGTVASRLSRGHAQLARALCRLGIAAAVLLACSWITWQATGPRVAFGEAAGRQRRSTLERTARDLHNRAGEEPALDIRSDSPAAIRTFLKDRGAPFANLAVRRPAGETDVYTPVGASLVAADHAPATAVYYRVNGAPVTLVTARAQDLLDAPQRSVMRLQVTHRVQDGVHSYVWTQAGQSYALVTQLPARQACRICHVDARHLRAILRDTPP